ncbi:MAG: glucose-6-phosphate dehydrogenase [Streptosporangiaceae bacterium]
MAAQATTTAEVLVIFGITGDLAEKQTFRALYRLERRGKLGCSIVGVARDEWSAATLRDHARQAIEDSGETISEHVFQRLAGRLSMVSGDYQDPETYDRVAHAIEGRPSPAFYLEIPPSLFGRVVEGLAGAGLTKGARVAVEKPFGHDLASARALNAELHTFLKESQIYRVDHFLGKEPTMDIVFLRFTNAIFEPFWNRDHIQSVQITMAEDFGVDDRGSFYDPVGALRDVVQNHLLQVLGLIASEPPSVADADGIRDKRVEVFRAIPPADPQRYVRGQYDGYLSVPGVSPRSQTETFAALRLQIDNWRWSGVPFFIRAGKELPERVTEVRIIFKPPPRLVFAPHTPHPDEFIVRIDPTPGADLVVQVMKPGPEPSLRTIDLSLIFAAELGDPPEPYERLLGDVLRGDARLFVREDSEEETWRIMQPLLDAPSPVEPYARGSWGPAAANTLLVGHPGWREPWLRHMAR